MADQHTTRSLTLYTRPACALCDHLVLALELMRARYRFEYTKIDVDDDPALTERYGLRVPVLLDDDTEICSGYCDPAKVEAYLAADWQSSRSGLGQCGDDTVPGRAGKRRSMS